MTIDTVILDIEGTICPISFVKSVLFPYFVKQLPTTLNTIQFPLNLNINDTNSNQASIVQTLSKLPLSVTTSSESTYNYLKGLVDNDVKDPVLKALQGLIWKQGYESGEIKSPVYPDSIDFIEKFPKREANCKIYIYSSGSINAQKLLFSHVDNGTGIAMDLNPQLSGYFDITTAGFKQEASSYTKIIDQIDKKDNEKSVLFLSDYINEVNAAIESGMNSYVVIREGNTPIPDKELASHKIIYSLSELNL
ncbi:enolase-phosphatase E1 [Lodderomyces elongisporus]|uniref:Enolase-phosphatase E1 n=1 Tax=Lodderomyces elongisporus (strain ATCC 11503 / CBS 2605 / JCM 1781 / NBRC 1676 / NRRL YB-4239) TaxID=379508 RepID=ENOPH_LODEL|nr:enolase-phosphatase E1 [Lodderomyces elongisporus]A5DUA7.1 RecName: Full=Enolase-phosphatase E1; AltName: Full=2,3-diketo-5-methylthio-1-phosphopentane phosphatase [Lodderomyces elongisporus NRRL YB-4239]EDK42765.1 hypothetical protein LELG_00943 [Lodderomyces elongisporus NRRL YB-4239]WLF77199.1 enolase-phosphatase E1 [Lodderomyces elongisporus]